jgi:hypothetical protein
MGSDPSGRRLAESIPWNRFLGSIKKFKNTAFVGFTSIQFGFFSSILPTVFLEYANLFKFLNKQSLICFDLSIVWEKQSSLCFDLSFIWNKQRSPRFDLF